MDCLLLDTNAYVAFQKRESTIQKIIESTAQIYVPWILLGELYFGSFDSVKTQENLNALEEFLAVDTVTILFPNKQTTNIYGEIAAEMKHIGKPLQQNDIWIAALAKQYDYPLMTRDKAFDNIIGLRLITW